jgi:DNA-binding SARP family transcriptional activator/ABC-type branched-subunit amino acid transport system substrate-binding protein/streptogramin lyase
MDFRLLGPLEVREGDRVISLGGGKQRALFAALLLHPNEVVSTERLIDELWGETAPPTAAKIVQNYISQLRKALAWNGVPQDGVLETRGRGYSARVQPGQRDIDRFEELVGEGRRTLAAGDAGRAADLLGAALALWRGPPLADFAYEQFAQKEIARLDERRLVALEERVEADLRLGRHEDLVGELEALVAENPLRERLRGQLMLALYRSGMQARALEVYRDARRLLLDELGLEPSQELRRLEGAILRQDVTLDPPPTARDRETRASSTEAASWVPARGRLLVVLAALALVLAGTAAALAVLLLRDGPEARVAPNSVGLIDPDTGRVVESIAVGARPTSIVVGEGAVWVLNADDQTISRIDPETRAVRPFATGSTPSDLAVGEGAVWVGSRENTRTPEITGLTRIDPVSGLVAATTTLPASTETVTRFGSTATRKAIAVGAGAVWVINPDDTVSRIDPETGGVVTTIRSVAASTIAAGDGAVWVATLDSTVAKIDPRTNAVAVRIPVAAESLGGIAVGGGAVWAIDPEGASVWRIDPGRERAVMRTIPVESGSTGIAYGPGSIWVLNSAAGSVTRIDARSNAVVERLELGASPLGVAVGLGSVWVSVAGADAGVTSSGGLVAGASCSETFFGGSGSPRYLIVSDLPLQGRSRTQALSIVEAIRIVLRERGFKAGRHTVGYQSCDDSTAQAQSFEYERCAANARAYVEDDRILGEIGAYNSDCSLVQLPITSGAEPPLPMVSPSNSYVGLTRPAPSQLPNQFGELYPSGMRNYVRVYPADDVEAAALALLARTLKVRSAFVLRDDDGGGSAVDLAERFRTSAGKLGVGIAGFRTWTSRSAGYMGLARAIRRSGADAVLLAGEIYSNGGRLLEDLRAELGPKVRLLASHGFSRAADVLDLAGKAGEGLYVSTAGTPTRLLPEAGRQFVDHFRSSRPGWLAADYYWAPYGAQAAAVLLDAIARSDGTRESVLRQLRATRIEDGILGRVTFNESGDIRPAAIVILRIKRGGKGLTEWAPDFTDGAVFDRVIRPPTSLIH